MLFDNIDDWLKWKVDPFSILEKKYGKEFADWARQNKGKVSDAWLNAGCKTLKEYKEKCAKNAGFRDYAEQIKIYYWNCGVHEPAEFNEDCTSNIGIKGEYNAKEKLLEIFKHVDKIEKGSHDGGIDFICENPIQEFIDRYPYFKLEKNKKYKIQHKCAILRGGREWIYYINRCTMSEYFMLSAYDIEFKLIYIWLIHRDESIRKGTRSTGYILCKLCDRTSISIYNDHKSSMSYIYFNKYEISGKLKMLKE